MSEIKIEPITDVAPRCQMCNKMLAYQVTRPYKLKCNRCGHVTAVMYK